MASLCQATRRLTCWFQGTSLIFSLQDCSEARQAKAYIRISPFCWGILVTFTGATASVMNYWRMTKAGLPNLVEVGGDGNRDCHWSSAFSEAWIKVTWTNPKAQGNGPHFVGLLLHWKQSWADDDSLWFCSLLCIFYYTGSHWGHDDWQSKRQNIKPSTILLHFLLTDNGLSVGLNGNKMVVKFEKKYVVDSPPSFGGRGVNTRWRSG